jgi:uncharacterized phage-associated protein
MNDAVNSCEQVDKTSALYVAKQLLIRLHEQGEQVTQLKLQKLLYFAQGWGLAINHEPFFFQNMEAWEYGPVIKDVRAEYRKYAQAAIPPYVEDGMLLDDDFLLDAIVDVYGKVDPWRLVAITYKEKPWHDYYQDGCSIVIPVSVVSDYFAGLLCNPDEMLHKYFLSRYTDLRDGVTRPDNALNSEHSSALLESIGIL